MRTDTSSKRGAAEAAPEAKQKQNGADGWVQVQSERPKWTPEECGKTPIQGYLLTRVELPKKQGGGSWHAYVVRLTAPSFALDAFGQSKEPREWPVGTEVLLPESVKLADLVKFLHPQLLIEVRVQAKDQVRTGGGHPMWTYDVQANQATTRPRDALTRTHIALLPSKVSESSGGDDLPF